MLYLLPPAILTLNGGTAVLLSACKGRCCRKLFDQIVTMTGKQQDEASALHQSVETRLAVYPQASVS